MTYPNAKVNSTLTNSKLNYINSNYVIEYAYWPTVLPQNRLSYAMI